MWNNPHLSACHWCMHFQAYCGVLSVDISTNSQSSQVIAGIHTVLIDHKGYFSTFSNELDLIAKIESFVQKGNNYIHSLYSHRSVSEAIPDIATDTLDSGKKNNDLGVTNADINAKILEILRPEIQKLRDVQLFVTQVKC